MPALGTWPVQHEVAPRYADLGTDGRVSLPALARWFEDARVGLHMPRFAALVERGAHSGGRWLLAAQHVERHAPVGYGTPARVGVGIRRIGRTSFVHGYGVETDGGTVATGESVLVLADEHGRPAVLPEEMRQDLGELRIEVPDGADAERPGPERAQLAHYPVTVGLPARIGDLDTNRHANNVVVLTWYAEGVAALQVDVLAGGWGGPPPELAPWRYRIQYVHEIGYPAHYDLGVAVAGYDDRDVHYALGIFHGDRCVGLADATGARGDLPGDALEARRPVSS